MSAFDIFLSHNSADKPAVELIAHKLKDAGVEPWLDKWYLVPGKTFQSGLVDALRSCPTCAVFIGPKGVGDWAREEVLVAQDRAAKEASYRLIPILLPGVPDPFDYSKLPPFLTQRTWVDHPDDPPGWFVRQRKGNSKMESALIFFHLIQRCLHRVFSRREMEKLRGQRGKRPTTRFEHANRPRFALRKSASSKCGNQSGAHQR